ncbi:LysR family transcriptional regulator [Opitutus terrae]|uniref:Transcriptional regulator, LysR family n=1 Tax=Opitutus terrae (strain DSM 11246 / JCM 15787 / PB90-1) TaxID=452637 RepID=B1ZVT1_OPITP|nr:LysR family transcriptional regulator [Opitutus terrae]ACB75017.1 transcriptional regulator, LysR family [Opitutus terrae PB90-1]
MNEALSSASRPLDSRQLLAFAALARCQSFTLAAKELFLTQSAVSHAIKALEAEVGSRLVDRANRRVLLTQAGEQFLRHVEKILREMEAARAGLDALSRWGHGRLRVGASTTACQYLLPTVLREFKQSFPKSVITIEPGDHATQVELLQSNRIDLAIMLQPETRGEFDFVPLFQDELRLLTSPVHAWVQQERTTPGSLAAETIVLYNKASYTFRLVTDYFRQERMTIGHFIELGSMDAIKELVKIGVGVGVLAPWVARAELENGALVSFPLGRKRLRRTWGIAYLRGRRLPLGEETFIGLCRSVTEHFGEVPADSADHPDVA